jgi:Mn-dependent DtxR family transcriptional regulator
MMRRLDDKGLLRYEKYRGVTLTPSGEKLARRITKRHEMLSEFLELMGIDGDTAYRDLEGMEHHISSQTLRGIEQLIEELRNDSAMRDRIRGATSDTAS